MPSIQELIKRMTEEANAYVDIAGRHEDRANKLLVEAANERHKAETIHSAIEVLRSTAAVMGEALEAPAKEAAAPAAPAPFPEAPNGTPALDRVALKRDLDAQRIRYPVGSSYRSKASIRRQCLITACLRHPDYRAYLDMGGHDLTDPYHRGKSNVDEAADYLEIDRAPIEAIVGDLYRRIFKQGVAGVDYGTKDNEDNDK